MHLGYYIKHNPESKTIDVIKAGEYKDVIINRFRYTTIEGDFEAQHRRASKAMRKLNS